MNARPPKGSPRETHGSAEPARVRERILLAFSTKAKRFGIRAVVMGELASELRMSAMTLYKHFASKDELVSAMVDEWALELAAIDALDWAKVDDCSSALEVLLTWADAWTASLGKVAPAFFSDLNRDHPDAWERFNALISERKQVAAVILRPFLRPDVNPAIAFLILDTLVTQAASPRFVEQLGISRREAVRTALSVWGGGALVQRTTLRALSSRDDNSPRRR
jgi:AcrR family transcriptional regulator